MRIQISKAYCYSCRLRLPVLLLLFCCTIAVQKTNAQRELIRSGAERVQQLGRNNAGKAGGGKDSLTRRDKNEDSITIYYRLPDSTRFFSFDSSVITYEKYFPIPANYATLGNIGSAAHPYLFTPAMKPGYDAGFHSFDLYTWKPEQVRFFNTTRPYTELDYMLGSRSLQIIEVLHTQNVKPNFNFAFQYRLINSPGSFKNQRTNHSNYIISSWYNTINKRYNAYFSIVRNKIQASENGGIPEETNMDSSIYTDRFVIFTNLGSKSSYSTNFFSSSLTTGNEYKNLTATFKHHYDFGIKDSIVTDSTVIPLFYPKLRFQHIIQYSTNHFLYKDFEPDSVYYEKYYNLNIRPSGDSIQYSDKWKELINDFSAIQFPDSKNLHQFIKAGVYFQNLHLKNVTVTDNFLNIWGHFEYRNLTRNKKWDMVAQGKLYLAGFNWGDYSANASIKRLISAKAGYLQLAFQNINRKPSFIFDNRSSFYLSPAAINLKKENNTLLSATLTQPANQLTLTANYYIIGNYTYFKNYYQPEQYNSIFNVLQVLVQKNFRVKKFIWRSDVYVQQKIGNAPVQLPAIFTRNRFAYEGNLGLKNLLLAGGIDIRYHTPYKADGYSPVQGQFFYQNNTTIKYHLPDIGAYLNFRIRGIQFYINVDNLNTASLKNGFNFTNNNPAAPLYYYPGMMMRLGIYWAFVN